MAAVRKAYAPISDDDENALFQEEPIQLTSNNKSTADADGHGNAHHLHPTRPYRLQSQRRKGARKSSWWGVILFTTSILIMATIFYRYSVSAATSAASSVGTTSEDQSVANTTDQTSFSADASPTTNIINSSSQTSNTSSSFIILDKYLKKLIIRRGDGLNFPKNGDQIGVYYIGIFASDEKEFDKSTTSVFETSIGVNRVIKGWDVGIPSMSLGEICNLYISSEVNEI